MTSEHVAFIGLETSKLKISVAIAGGERNGEVRFLGDISSEPSSVAAMVKKLANVGQSSTSAMKPAPRDMGSIGRSLNWITNAVSSRRHWCQSVPVTA
nr:IS110 family transposase [Rhizobium sp. Q54]